MYFKPPTFLQFWDVGNRGTVPVMTILSVDTRVLTLQTLDASKPAGTERYYHLPHKIT